MNLQQAKKIPIMYFFKDILGLKGKMSGENILYNSPFRDDKTPSYSVSISKNISYDFATGEARDIVGSVADYYKISTSEALEKLAKFISHTPPKEAKRYIPKEIIKRPFAKGQEKIKEKQEKRSEEILNSQNQRVALRTKIVEIKDLFYFPLKNYIQEIRKISLETAQIYLKEVHFNLRGENKLYFGLTWQNISNGYEITRYSTTHKKSFKTAIGTKDISFFEGIEKNSDKVLIFEGMFDFLSYLEYEKRKYLKEDVIILNSISCQKKACEYIKNQRKYKEIYLFLDNDEEGKKTTQKIKQNLDMNLKAFENTQQRNRGIREFSQNSRGTTFKIGDIFQNMLGIAVFDKSELYQGFKDVNEWWIQFNKIKI